MQRYIELEGQLRRAISVVKVRSSPHSKDLREYEVTKEGVVVMGGPIHGYEGLLSGAPNKLKRATRTAPKGGKRNDPAKRRPRR